MEHFCTQHSVQLSQGESKTKFNPDGSAKTYWYHKTANNRMCFGDDTGKSTYTPKMAQKAEEIREKLAPEAKVNWDEISKGKVRHGVAVAFIEHLGAKPPEEIDKVAIDAWTDYIMTGK